MNKNICRIFEFIYIFLRRFIYFKNSIKSVFVILFLIFGITFLPITSNINSSFISNTFAQATQPQQGQQQQKPPAQPTTPTPAPTIQPANTTANKVETKKPGTASVGTGVVGTFSNWAINIFSWLVYLVVWFLGLFLLVLFNVLTAVASYNEFLSAAAVVKGWVVVRDIANMGIIIFLLIIAFGIMLRLENYGNRKMLGKLLLMAILINFSKTICGFLIDISQVVMLTFVNGFKFITGPSFVRSMKLYEMMQLGNVKTQSGADGKNVALAAVASICLALVFMVTVFAVIIVIIMTLIWRIVNLWLLIILSPLAFLGSAVPFLQSFYSEWMKKFSNFLISGPLLAFFLWLSITIMNGMQNVGSPNKDLATQSGVTSIHSAAGGAPAQNFTEAFTGGNVSLLLMSIGLLVGGLVLSAQFGAVGANEAVGMIKSGVKTAVKTASKWAAKGAWKGTNAITSGVGLAFGKEGMSLENLGKWSADKWQKGNLTSRAVSSAKDWLLKTGGLSGAPGINAISRFFGGAKSNWGLGHKIEDSEKNIAKTREDIKTGESNVTTLEAQTEYSKQVEVLSALESMRKYDNLQEKVEEPRARVFSINDSGEGDLVKAKSALENNMMDLSAATPSSVIKGALESSGLVGKDFNFSDPNAIGVQKAKVEAMREDLIAKNINTNDVDSTKLTIDGNGQISTIVPQTGKPAEEWTKGFSGGEFATDLETTEKILKEDREKLGTQEQTHRQYKDQESGYQKTFAYRERKRGEREKDDARTKSIEKEFDGQLETETDVRRSLHQNLGDPERIGIILKQAIAKGFLDGAMKQYQKQYGESKEFNGWDGIRKLLGYKDDKETVREEHEDLFERIDSFGVSKNKPQFAHGVKRDSAFDNMSFIDKEEEANGRTKQFNATYNRIKGGQVSDKDMAEMFLDEPGTDGKQKINERGKHAFMDMGEEIADKIGRSKFFDKFYQAVAENIDKLIADVQNAKPGIYPKTAESNLQEIKDAIQRRKGITQNDPTETVLRREDVITKIEKITEIKESFKDKGFPPGLVASLGPQVEMELKSLENALLNLNKTLKLDINDRAKRPEIQTAINKAKKASNHRRRSYSPYS